MKKKKLFMLTVDIFLIYILSASIYFIFYCNPKYNEKDKIVFNDNYLKVNETFITSYNDKNELITDTQTFLIVSLDTNLNRNDIVLKINNNYYSNNNEYYNYFNDVTKDYNVYLIDNKDIMNEMYLFYRSKEIMLTRNYNILLKPTNLDLKKDIKDFSLGDIISINDIRTNIQNYEIDNYFIDYYLENNKKINLIINNNSGYVLKLHLTNTDNINKIDNYIKLKYIINNEELTSTISLIDTKILNNNIYFKVNKDIIKSDKIWIIFTSRNKEYNYYLKA